MSELMKKLEKKIRNNFDLESEYYEETPEGIHNGEYDRGSESFHFTVSKEEHPDSPSTVKSIVQDLNSEKKEGFLTRFKSSLELEIIQSMEGEKAYFFTIVYGVRSRNDALSLPPRMPKNTNI